MPKTNLCKPKEDKLTVLIRGHYPTGASLARALGCSQPKAAARLWSPDKLTRGELRKLVKSGIPAEDILGAIL